ncbi:MAG: hypothetical protein HF973_01185, partial [Chloroflexi bacterium]|nr:hypothetical protein [Chloroflexota bacterium]
MHFYFAALQLCNPAALVPDKEGHAPTAVNLKRPSPQAQMQPSAKIKLQNQQAISSQRQISKIISHKNTEDIPRRFILTG